MTNLEIALNYASIGMAVFPIVERGKNPLTEHGFHDATTDSKQIKDWWTHWPRANIGIATGRKSGNIYVLDLDIDEDSDINGFESLRKWEQESGQHFPDETWSAITGRGGYHYYFKSEKSVKSYIGLLEGVDIRGNGGYVVVPPSIHKNGRSYVWEIAPEDCSIQYADKALETLLRDTDLPRRNNEGFKVPKKIVKGERNSTLFKAACSFQSKGLPDSTIMIMAKDLNRSSCEIPLSDDEVEQLVDSALKYDKGKLPSSIDEDSGDPEELVFETDKNENLLQTSANMVRALIHDPRFKGKIRKNTLAHSPYIFGRLPWMKEWACREWTNTDDANFCTFMENEYGFKSRPKMQEALNVILGQNEFNPVCDYLEDIYKNSWDGQSGHIEKLLPNYLGVENTTYTRECMTLLMVGAINRVFHPGCKFDYMMVIVGPQGIGKSTFFQKLALKAEWYNDNFNTVDGDKASEKLRGVWIAEMAELLATKKAKDVEAIKSFITSTVDLYRPPYERRTESRPRMCVFVGTTNNEQFLTDRTGNRRFLPIVARPDFASKSLFDDKEMVEQDFLNAWGEAVDIYYKQREGDGLILSKEALLYAEKMQSDHTEEDVRTGLIQEYLDSHKDINRVCACMLYREALGHEGQTPNRHETNEILTIMSNEISGWARVSKKSRCKGYGIVVCFERKATQNSPEFQKSNTDGSNDDGFMPVPDDADLPF